MRLAVKNAAELGRNEGFGVISEQARDIGIATRQRHRHASTFVYWLRVMVDYYHCP